MKRTSKKAMPFAGAGKADKSRKGARASETTFERKAAFCPALAMARLMGTHQEAASNFDRLASVVGLANDADREWDLDRGNQEAFGVAEIARLALALTKAESLEGAFAKIIVSWEVSEDLHSNKHDEFRGKLLQNVIGLLQEDAVNYFVREIGIDLGAIGVASYYGATGKPMAVIDKAWKLARETVAAEVEKRAAA